jgi:predicted dehydrogenase
MTIDIGLLGCGRWGHLILRDLLALGARVHVVAPSEATRAFAASNGAASAVARVEAIAELVAGFVVATPTSTHAEVIEKLFVTGRPIFVEKPLTNDVASARRIVAAAGERVFVMDKWRYHPGIEALAAIARSGELGCLVAIRSYRLGWNHTFREVDPVWILMPHDLSIAFEILGSLPAPRAAWTPVVGRGGCDMIAVLADDSAGPQVTIEVGTSQPLCRRSTLVIGDRGVAQLGDAYDDKIVIMDGRPDGASSGPQERPVGNAMPLLKELRAFLNHLIGGPPPRSSAAEGLLIVERTSALRALAGLQD